MGNAAAETRKWESQLLNTARKNEQALRTLGIAGVAGGAAVALGLGKAVKASMDFEKQMSGVAAVAGASTREMQALSDAAIAAGKSTELAGVTAMSAAAAEAELVKAGISTADVLDGALTGALSLATAGQLDMAQAAEIAGAAMNTFNLAGEDVEHVADVLASAANKSAADVGSLGMAMRQAGLVAGQTGVSLEETVGTLAAFADRGLQASDAGTSLRTLLLRLSPTSAEAAEMMQQIGFSAFDAQGEFVGMEEVSGRLQTALAGMSTEQRNVALATIFGQDAIRGANVLIELGTDGVRDYTNAVNDQGAAQRMSAIQTDNLAGSVEAFGGAAEAALIDFGENAQGASRAVVDFGTNTINTLAGMPEPVQDVALVVGGLGSAASIAAGGFMLALPSIAKFKDALATAGPKAQLFGNGILRAGGALAGPWGLALGAGAAALLFYANRKAEANQRTEEFIASLDEETGALTGESRALTYSELKRRGAIDAAKELGINTALITRAALGESGAYEILSNQLDKYRMNADGTLDVSTAEIEVAHELRAAIDGVAQSVAADTQEQQRRQLAMANGEPVSIAALERQMAMNKALDDGKAAIDPFTASTKELTEAEIELNETQQAYADTLSGFTDPMGAYSSLLERKEEEERATAEATAESTKSQKDSWEDFVKEAKVSLGEWIKEMEREVEAAEEWEDNMLILAGRVSKGTLDQLAAMGPEAAPIVARLVDASDKELNRLERVFRDQTDNATEAQRQRIEAAQPMLRAVAGAAGEKAAAAWARKLASGKATMEQLGREFGVTFAGAFNGAARVRMINGFTVRDAGTQDQNTGPGFHAGGMVPGARTGADTYPAMLTPGEFVVNEAAVGKYGTPFLAAINNMRMPTGGSGGAGVSIDYDRLAQAVKGAGGSNFTANVYNPQGRTSEQSLAQVLDRRKAAL